MKILFISYEYPPDSPVGGIGTYVLHATRMLARAGHYVEVVSASPFRSGTEVFQGVTVNRVLLAHDKEWQFGSVAAPVLQARNKLVGGFDIVESPEYRAEGAEFIADHPELPLVVKLHTPTYLVHRLSAPRLNFLSKCRFALGAIRRGMLPRWPPPADSRPAIFEQKFTTQADHVVAPCPQIANIVAKDWSLLGDRVSVVPNPFEEELGLGDIPLPEIGRGHRILFVGRLEPRKGVQHLGLALRLIRRRLPSVSLRCVGPISTGPIAGESMDVYMRRTAGRSAIAIEFPGALPRHQLAAELANADVCVFPSLWENFPNVCLEAMCAARPVIGSSAGGMTEMLADAAGVLVPPGSPRRWANAIELLMADGELRRSMGQRARERVSRKYSYCAILGTQLAAYQEAIRHRKAQGPRRTNSIPSRPH